MTDARPGITSTTAHGATRGERHCWGGWRIRGLVIGSAIWLALYALALALTDPGSVPGKILNDGAYLVPVALATVSSFLAARRSTATQRRFWSVLAASNLLWLIGELTWTTYVVLAGQAPFPSVADGFYLGSYLLVPAAVLLGFGTTRKARAVRGVLDGSIAAVALGTCGYLLTIGPQLSGGFSLATATGIAYPLLGVVILVLLVGLGVTAQRTIPAGIGLVALAFAISAITDAAYTYAAVLHSFIPGQWLNLGWQAEALLLTIAAVVAIRHPNRPAVVRHIERDIGFPVVLAGLVGSLALVGLDVADGDIELPSLVAVGYCVIAVMVRMYLTGRDRTRLARDLERALAEQERLAVTDVLTGLHNRRFFDELLTIEVERSIRYRTRLALLVIDLDHFKAVNDGHGHPAGDAVLIEVGRRIRDTVRMSDVVARYGGEEFAIILTDADDAHARLTADRIRQAIGGRRVVLDHAQVAVTASIGIALMPGQADSKAELLRLADRALYQAKRLGRNQVQADGADRHVASLPEGTSLVLDYLQNLADEIDCRQGPSCHSVAMAAFAARVAERLGEDDEVRVRAVLAARFLDIGKVVVPDSILRKAGSLTEHEWLVIREHPEQGARLAGLAPSS